MILETREPRNFSQQLKIAYDLVKNNDGNVTELSNSVLKNAFKDSNLSISTNNMVSIRRALPLSCNQIIPIIVKKKFLRRDKCPMGFVSLDEENYQNYKFSIHNFRKLEDIEISMITYYLRKSGMKDNRIILKFLTLCDIFLVSYGRNDFVKVERSKFCRMIMEDEKSLDILLNALVSLHVLSKADGLYRFNYIYKRIDNSKSALVNYKEDTFDENDPDKFFFDDSTNGNITIPEESEISILKDAVVKYGEKDDAQEYIESIPSSLVNLAKQLYLGILEKEKEYNFQKEKISSLTEQVHALKIAKKEYSSMERDNEKMKEEIQGYSKNVRDFNRFKKVIRQRIETVMGDFTLKLDKYINEYENDHDKGRFMMKLHALSSDTISSVVNLSTSIGTIPEDQEKEKA